MLHRLDLEAGFSLFLHGSVPAPAPDPCVPAWASRTSGSDWSEVSHDAGRCVIARSYCTDEVSPLLDMDVPEVKVACIGSFEAVTDVGELPPPLHSATLHRTHLHPEPSSPKNNAQHHRWKTC